jgi:hypothetical protein
MMITTRVCYDPAVRVSIRILLALAAVAGAPACKGSYATGSGMQSFSDRRGETNGRSFDFVSTKPDGSEWTIRVRGTAMWVGYAKGKKTDELGSFGLSDDEYDKLWGLVDGVDIASRKHGKVDPEHGTVSMHLREVTNKGEHDLETVFVSRDTDDEDVIALADYLATLVENHKNERPAF